MLDEIGKPYVWVEREEWLTTKQHIAELEAFVQAYDDFVKNRLEFEDPRTIEDIDSHNARYDRMIEARKKLSPKG